MAEAGGIMASSNAPLQDDAVYADRRAHARVPVALPAFLQAGGERHFVQILDLSAAGAKLSCGAKPPVGSAVTLDCGTLGRSGVVRWQNGEVVGLCFDSELGERELSALVERSRALETMQSKK
jgi:hypothetical protein